MRFFDKAALDVVSFRSCKMSKTGVNTTFIPILHFIADWRILLSLGEALKKLEEVSLTCKELEEAVKNLEAKAESQSADLECIKASCKHITHTLDILSRDNAITIKPNQVSPLRSLLMVQSL